jgi:hypothetical protein
MFNGKSRFAFDVIKRQRLIRSYVKKLKVEFVVLELDAALEKPVKL